jgi:prepilin-type N-terminal cleavage/methylation domain-containing protein
MSSRARHRGGFTLIELLVVISIVAVLSAVLTPTVATAKEKGRRARCMSNIRQVYLAMFLYANDHEGVFYTSPIHDLSSLGGRVPGYQNDYTVHPYEGLSNYAESSSILYCPTALAKKLKHPSFGYPAGFQHATIQPWGSLLKSDTHYGYFWYMQDRAPAHQVFLFEAPYAYGHADIAIVNPGAYDAELELGTGSIYFKTGAQLFSGLGSVDPSPTPHGVSDGSNVCYMDGTVFWQTGKRIKPLHPCDKLYPPYTTNGWKLVGWY